MCGLVGMVAAQPRAQERESSLRESALAALRHRGPDDEGQYRDEKVWLAHTRLSVIDLTSAGCQPMQSNCGRFVITYNGEVYNFRELVKSLHLSGLRSNSDTEVVLQLFAKLGLDSLSRLNGMFAFCIYDRGAQKLWLVRDRLGIKPLYYRIDSQSLVFASEIKAILALIDAPPECNTAALHEWLYYGNPLGGRTLYSGIQQLPPGHYLEFDLQSFSCSTREFWSLERQAGEGGGVHPGKENMAGEVRRRLEQAVRRQLVSDVPVGVFLSGGVDSSAIAAFASRHYAGKLTTYSVGFDFAKDGGELPKARRVADLFRTEHHEIHIGGEDVADLVEQMVGQHDMPFADAANIPLYLMAARISGHTKVVLQGDGGDELFGGYRRYATLKYHSVLHPLARILQHLPEIAPESPLRFRIQRYLHAFGAENLATTIALLLTPEDLHSNPTDVFSPRMQRALRRTDPFARVKELLPTFGAQDMGNQMSFIDMSIILPDTYLEKVDRSTMAASLEVRVPFLDNDLVDYVVHLSGSQKMPFGRQKWLLKSALRGIVPEEILFGKKTGFNVPFDRWLQTSLKPMFFDHLNRFAQRRPDVLNVTRIRMLFERTSARRQDHSPMLWKILNFLVWANNSPVEFPQLDVQ